MEMKKNGVVGLRFDLIWLNGVRSKGTYRARVEFRVIYNKKIKQINRSTALRIKFLSCIKHNKKNLEISLKKGIIPFFFFFSLLFLLPRFKMVIAEFLFAVISVLFKLK